MKAFSQSDLQLLLRFLSVTPSLALQLLTDKTHFTNQLLTTERPAPTSPHISDTKLSHERITSNAYAAAQEKFGISRTSLLVDLFLSQVSNNKE